MPRFSWLLSSLVCAGLITLTEFPVRSQALIPYTPEINSEKLQNQGLQLLQDAVQLIKFQQYELALPRAELAAQLAPDNYEAWFILGSLYAQLSELDRGIEALEQAEKLAPDQEGILLVIE